MRFFFCRFLSECAIGCLLEVMREQYTEFYKEKEQWRYLKKMDTNHKLLSLERFTDSEGICLISLLMKQLLSKSAQTTGQILILTGGFTDVRHGVEDGGTVERVAVEKINLAVMLKMRELLENQSIRVVLTREQDMFMKL